MNKAFIFDMNGTMVDDMAYHREAWSNVINKTLQANLSKQQVDKEMYGKNEELLERVFGKGRFTQEEMDKISRIKEDAYQEAFRPHLKLIDGLDDFLEQAHSLGIAMSIGTAAIPYNINFVMDHLDLGRFFTTIISANDVKISKPHPETFLLCAQGMNARPENCIVFEDAPKGVEAALNAGMRAIAVTTMHAEADFAKYGNVLFCIQDYMDARLDTLLTAAN